MIGDDGLHSEIQKHTNWFLVFFCIVLLLVTHPLAEALCGLTFEDLASGLQVTDRNILVGLEDRLGLLHHLGQVLQTRSDFFGGAVPRPGNLMGTQRYLDTVYFG
jgi:hypothetical protein